MQIKVYKFTGLTPLLMSNIESVNRDLPQLKLGTKPNKGDIEKIAEGMTYRNEDGNLYVPTQALRSSLLTGCAGQKFPGSRQSPRTILQALIFPAEDRATVLDGKGKPATKIEPQIDSGVNKASKSRIIVVRARIPSWSMVVPFEIDDEFAPSNFEQFMDTVITLWNRAGRTAGIGAWRPEKQGRHGRYQVELQK
jgi:hypothetical protein